MRNLITSLLGLSTLTLFASLPDEHVPDEHGIRVVQVPRTPEGTHVRVFIQYPKDYEVKMDLPIHLQVRLIGFPLGSNIDADRNNEIRQSDKGQTLRIFIDDRPYIALNEANTPNDLLDDHDEYYDQTVEDDFYDSLSPGMHVLRTVPARSFGESLKGDGCFGASIFYYKTKKIDSSINLNGPYLTYNEPQGEYSSTQPIMVDFYLTNCELSEDGYKVRLTIDGTSVRTLTEWTPYYVYGLTPGTHKVRLQLLDSRNHVVPGLFNDTQRTIRVN